ncbi:MAG: high-affinity K+ transport system ATPase subunit B [Candidatus Woesearchaeota archaeon]|jgi:high-affinity K+ transport system ATPase subunit B
MKQIKRKTSTFEKLLLATGLLLVVIGIASIKTILHSPSKVFSIEAVIAVVLWFILLFMLILAAISENTREEITQIVHTNSEELKVQREVLNEQLAELQKIRHGLSKK